MSTQGPRPQTTMDENVDVKQFGELTQEVQIVRAVGIGFYLGTAQPQLVLNVFSN